MLMFDIESKIESLYRHSDSLYDLIDDIYVEIMELKDMYNELIGEMICDEKEQINTINENSNLKQEIEDLNKKINTSKQ